MVCGGKCPESDQEAKCLILKNSPEGEFFFESVDFV